MTISLLKMGIKTITIRRHLKVILVAAGSLFIVLGYLSIQSRMVNASAQATRVEILIYLDINGDKLMSDGEGIENLPVIADVNGQRQVKMSQGGQVIFSLPYANSENLRIEIPYLALAEEAKTDSKTGLAKVEFRLVSPELPVYLP